MNNPKLFPNHHGWLFLDKPYGLSSNAALQNVRRLFDRIKAGHAGTLDPRATGMLAIALGEGTKIISYMMNKTKVYEFTVTWGQQRDTDDSEGTIIATSTHVPLNDDIINALPHFTGHISQKPPIYSAIKINGQKMYDLARRGEAPEQKFRHIHIQNFELIYQNTISPEISLKINRASTFKVICSSGTYIRSLARDLAHYLGTVGYVSYLRRLAIGPFSQEKMVTFDKLLEFKGAIELKEFIHPLDIVLDDIPVVILNHDELSCLQKGQRILNSRTTKTIFSSESSPSAMVALKDSEYKMYGLGFLDQGIIHPKRMFNI